MRIQLNKSIHMGVFIMRNYSIEQRACRLAHYIVTEEDKDIIEFEFMRYDMFCNSVLDYLTLITYKELVFIYINDIDRVLDKYRTKLKEVNKKPDENFLNLAEKAKSEMRTNIELYD